MPEIAHSQLRPTPTIEDYLAVMYVMERDNEEVIAARLAESLGVAPPTVTVTLKRMERDGWITPQAPRGIRLTEAGCQAASTVIRRHMLIEWMLARMLKVPWQNLHAEAHNIEHTISDEIEAQMRLNLDNPKFCPHGNPLPDYEYIAAAWLPLNSIEPGERVTIRRIHETAENDPALLRFLEANGIVPGVQVNLSENLSFNQTLTLQLRESKVVLGYPVARFIFVEKVG